MISSIDARRIIVETTYAYSILFWLYSDLPSIYGLKMLRFAGVGSITALLLLMWRLWKVNNSERIFPIVESMLEWLSGFFCGSPLARLFAAPAFPLKAGAASLFLVLTVQYLCAQSASMPAPAPRRQPPAHPAYPAVADHAVVAFHSSRWRRAAALYLTSSSLDQ